MGILCFLYHWASSYTFPFCSYYAIVTDLSYAEYVTSCQLEYVIRCTYVISS